MGLFTVHASCLLLSAYCFLFVAPASLLSVYCSLLPAYRLLFSPARIPVANWYRPAKGFWSALYRRQFSNTKISIAVRMKQR